MILATVQSAATLVAVWLLLRHQRSLERAWTEERRELLNRVQRPEHIPLPASAQFAFPEPDNDELELVGTISPPSSEQT